MCITFTSYIPFCRNISSATFGALSEGEREFLKNIGISENVSEESNVAYLEERLKTLQRARDRLRTRPPLIQSPGAGARPDPLGIRK